MLFIESVKNVFLKWKDFSTRSSRAEYWYWCLFHFLISTSFFILAKLPSVGALFLNLAWVVGFLVFVPSLSVTVRRLHDTGISAWGLLINLLPILGNLIFLYWMIKKSEAKDNYWGKVPAK